MDDAPAVIREAVVVATSSWSDPSVIVGVVTAALFICVLIAQIAATRATWRAANAAKASVDLAKTESDLRLAPFISVPDLNAWAVKDKSGRVLVRRNLQSGLVDLTEARSHGQPETMVYRIEMKNSGPIAAMNVGHGLGHDFNRDKALGAMRADTGYSGTLVPPGSSTTHDIEIPAHAVDVFRADQDHPYFVAFSVAYEDHKGCGFLVEVEWEQRGSNITALRHSPPESYSGEPILS